MWDVFIRAEEGRRDVKRSRGDGEKYKRQVFTRFDEEQKNRRTEERVFYTHIRLTMMWEQKNLVLIHILRSRLRGVCNTRLSSQPNPFLAFPFHPSFNI